MQYTPKNKTTTAYSSSLVVKKEAGILYNLNGYNSSSNEQFIQIHDWDSVPIDGEVPKIIFRVPSKSNFSFDFGANGRGFSNGIVICNSSYDVELFIGSNDCWFDAQYM